MAQNALTCYLENKPMLCAKFAKQLLTGRSHLAVLEQSPSHRPCITSRGAIAGTHTDKPKEP
jgi:hypothetical protein